MVKKQLPILVSWIGGNDLKALAGGLPGPVLSTLRADSFTRAELLCSYPSDQLDSYRAWLAENTETPLNVYHEPLSSPVNFAEIYQAAEQR
tara:strand:- start:213 stop:485 length:273 start_codon:yes stop_codon:yes gene_type:complete